MWETELVESHRLGSMFGVLSVHLWGGFTQLRQGELDEAEASLRAGIEQMQLWGLSTLDVRLRVPDDDPDRAGQGGGGARATLSEVEPPPSSAEDGMQFWRQAEIELLLAEGKAEEALAAIGPYAELADWRRNPVWTPSRSLRARALDMLGRTDEARAELEDELERARALGGAGHHRQDADPARGDRARAGDRASRGGDRRCWRAASAASTWPRRWRRSAARCAAPASRPRRASRCGARSSSRSAAARTRSPPSIRTELHATGVRPRGSALKGPGALTASERRVADLAAQGQTNKQIAQTLFVTPKTVEVHLSNAYRKLEISSRGELSEALAEDS